MHDLNKEQERTASQAEKWAAEHKDEVIEKIVKAQIPEELEKPFGKLAIFTAGAPGSGKSEFSHAFLHKVNERFPRSGMVRLDVDDVRVMNPYYIPSSGGVKGNAQLIQKAANKGLEYCRRYCLKNEIPFLLDSTLSYPGAEKFIKKLIHNNWSVWITFVFQNPEHSWQFALAREKKEGRNITRENFLNGFFGSIDMIEKIKRLYPTVRTFLVIKDKGETKAVQEREDIWEEIQNQYTQRNLAFPSRDDILKMINNGGDDGY